MNQLRENPAYGLFGLIEEKPVMPDELVSERTEIPEIEITELETRECIDTATKDSA
jgi:hypothetical protein